MQRRARASLLALLAGLLLAVLRPVAGAAPTAAKDSALLTHVARDELTEATLVEEMRSLWEALGAANISPSDAKSAAEAMVKRGYYEGASALLKTAAASGRPDIAREVGAVITAAGQAARAKLQALLDAVPSIVPAAPGAPPVKGATNGGKPVPAISPAFEWAQSADAIYMSVKWSHKLDTPATLGCETTGFSITAVPPPAEEAASTNGTAAGRSSMSLSAECIEKRKHFALDLGLWGAVEPPPASAMSKMAVGRVMVTLKKAANGTWPRLLHSKTKPAAMHVWWAMREKIEKGEVATPTPSPSASAAPAAEEGSSSPSPTVVAVAADGEAAAPTVSATPAVTAPTSNPDLEAAIAAVYARRDEQLKAVSREEAEGIAAAEKTRWQRRQEADAAAAKLKEELRAAAKERRSALLSTAVEEVAALKAGAVSAAAAAGAA